MRGKDKQPRKKDNYSRAISKRISSNLEAHRKIVSEGRKNEKEIPLDTLDITKEEALEAINGLFPWTQGTNRKVFANKPLYKFILNYTKIIQNIKIKLLN